MTDQANEARQDHNMDSWKQLAYWQHHGNAISKEIWCGEVGKEEKSPPLLDANLNSVAKT